MIHDGVVEVQLKRKIDRSKCGRPGGVKTKPSTMRILDLHREGLTSRDIVTRMNADGFPTSMDAVQNALHRAGLKSNAKPSPQSRQRQEYLRNRRDEIREETADARVVSGEIDRRVRAYFLFSHGATAEAVMKELGIGGEEALRYQRERPKDWDRMK